MLAETLRGVLVGAADCGAEFPAVINAVRSRCALTGNQIRYTAGGQTHSGQADLDQDWQLSKKGGTRAAGQAAQLGLNSFPSPASSSCLQLWMGWPPIARPVRETAWVCASGGPLCADRAHRRSGSRNRLSCSRNRLSCSRNRRSCSRNRRSRPRNRRSCSRNRPSRPPTAPLAPAPAQQLGAWQARVHPAAFAEARRT